MATFLDLGILQSLKVVFTFLFVFAITYAILNKVNFPKDSKSLQSFVAFILGAFVVLSGKTVDLITTMSPWFVIMFIFIIFVLLANMIFGLDDAYLSQYMKDDNTITTWIIILSALILVISVGTTYSSEFLDFTQNATGDSTGDVGHNIGAAIFHPKVLGFIFVMLIGTFAILLLTKTPVIK
jgi:hypothetical protein